MAENPLLPHRKLRELYALMERCRKLDRKMASSAPRPMAREALLAATAMHLLPGDLLCAQPGDRAAAPLAPAAKSASGSAGQLAASPDLSQRLLLCAAAARGLQAAGAEGVLLAYASAGANAGWAAALEWAQTAQLPLLLACTDSTGQTKAGRRPSNASGRAAVSEAPLTLAAMNRLAQRLRLPVMPVEGEDAVAVYRVMQESALRARMGGGPAVIWALMTPLDRPNGLPSSQHPLPRLKSYMAVRKIALK